MAAQDTGERTEAPTPKRRKDLRRKGVIARTPELTAWGGLLLVVAVGPWVGSRIVESYRGLIETMVEFTAAPDVDKVAGVFGRALLVVIETLAPLFAVVVAFAVVANLAQTKGMTSFSLLAPKWERISPTKGIKRLVGVQGLWGVAKATAKVVLLTAVAWGPVRDASVRFAQQGAMTPQELARELGAETLRVVQLVALVGLGLAVVDWLFVWRRVRQQSMMTKDEVKQEYKEQEGNPEVRARRRQLARQLAFEARQLASVRESDVVVVNPTHYAVALRYDPTWGPPKVVARGVEGFALRIRREALDAGVPVVADAELARFLHASCRLHAAIGDDLFSVVALLLHFVDSLDRRRLDQPVVPPRPLLGLAGVPRTAPVEATAAGAGSVLA